MSRLKTPIGTALLVTDEGGLLRALDWSDHEDRLYRLLRLYYGAGVTLETAKPQVGLRNALDGYFAGDLKQLDGIACATSGTACQRSVWGALRKNPGGRDHELWRAGGETRQAGGDACWRCGQPCQPFKRVGALPSPDRRQ